MTKPKAIKIQPKRRSEEDGGVLPYPFVILADRSVGAQELWKGNPNALVGFTHDMNVDEISLRWEEFYANPQAAVGQYAVFMYADGTWHTSTDPIETVTVIPRRQCYWVSETQYDEGKGYVPSLVTEDEPGHSPLRGKDDSQTPWYWGDTIEKAREVVEQANRDTFGIEPEQAEEILLSSMNAGKVQNY